MRVGGSPILGFFLLAALIVIVLFGLHFASAIIAPILLDAILAVLFAPVLRWLERKGLPSPLALVVLIFILILVFSGVILVIVISLGQLQTRLPVYQDLLLRRLSALEQALAARNLNIANGLNIDAIDATSIVKTALTAVVGLLTNVVGIFFFLFLFILMLVESATFTRKLQARFSPENPLFQRMTLYIRLIQRQYRIQALSNLLSASAITLVLFLFRIDFAFLWGFLAFVLGFIPNIGLILACLPAVLIALLLYGILTALVVVLLIILLNAAMDNLVTPKFMGEGLNLSLLLILLSFIIWSGVFGFLGALLAVPMTLFIRALLQTRQEAGLFVVLLNRDGGERGAAEEGDEQRPPQNRRENS